MPSYPHRQVALLCSLLASSASLSSCGFLVGSGPDPARPGKALESFARELGVEVAVAGETDAVDPGASLRFRDVDEATLERFFAEGREAQGLLASSYRDGRPDLDALPSAESRVSSLARARGLVLDLDRQRDAQALLESILEAEPRHVIALELLAESKRRSGDSAAAVRIFRELASAFPARPRFALQLARVLIRVPTKGAAAEDRRAIARAHAEGERLLSSLVDGPLGIEAASELGVRLLRRFRPEQAEAVSRKALRTRPRHPELEFLLGRALRYQGQYDAALELLIPLTRLDRGANAGLVDDARYQVVWCLRGLERFDEARRQLAVLREGGGFADSPRLLDALEPALVEESEKKQRVSYSLIELRYLLRKSPDDAQRENALEILMQNTSAVEGVDTDFLYVLRRDSKAALRSRALVALLRLDPSHSAAVEIALADASDRNRMIAAGQASRLPRAEAVPLLFSALGRESNPAVFTAVHESLRSITEMDFFLPDGAAETEEGRASVVTDWASRLGLKRPEKATSQQSEQRASAQEKKS